MIRKRLLSACPALALCLSLLPVTALAAENDRPYSLYVGNTDVAKTEYSDNAAYWTSSDGGTNWTSQLDEPTADSYIHYDGNGTLTLHNVNISRSNENGIYAEAMSGSAVSLTIKLEEENKVSGASGIYVFSRLGDASLSISGTGSLTAEGTGGGSFSGIQVQSNDGKAELTINNVDVTATNNVAQGIILRSGGSSTASLTVNGGELTASGSDAGIKYVFGSSGTGDGTPTVTVSDNAIVRANGGISDDSSTDIQIGADSSASSGGIVFDGKNGTVYGSVALQENLTIGDGQTLSLADDSASLTPGGHNVILDGGTLLGDLTTTLGDSVKYTPTITTENTTLTGGTVNQAYTAALGVEGTTPITWSLAEDNNMPPGLTLNSNGTITGTPTAAGTYSFTVTATNDYGSDSKEFTLTIDQQGTIHVTSVTLNKSETTLTVGGTETLTATITPSTATNQNVMWTSDNEAVATVDNGVVSAVGSGTAIITVTTADGNYTAVCTVSVTPYIPPVPSYLIQLTEVEGGTVTADRATARQGTEVALTVTPDEGFALASLTVTDFFGNQVDISRNSDGTYSFVMPASQVTVSAVFAPAQLPFTDVTEANWYYDEVYYVWANGLMQGTSATTFGPGVDTTRAMVVTILWRLEGEPASGYDMDYSDVAGGAWYAGAVRWATEHGIVNGSEGQFYPGGTVTREQLAAMLYRYAQYKGYDLTAGGDLSGFADAGAVSGWAETSLAWAVGQGLLQGSDSQVDPQGSAIRAQTAAILMRFCENMLE